jgi:L-arabinose isomerase
MTSIPVVSTSGPQARQQALAQLLPRVPRRPTRVGLVAGGLGAYWPQFPELLPRLRRSADRVAERMRELDCEVIDVGFISDPGEGARAAEELRVAGCDLIVAFLTTYMTATMLVPVAQRSGAPVLLLNLQPTEAMDHASFDTGQWLAYCGACPLPEMANAFRRCGIETRSVSGYLQEDAAWTRIAHWVRAAGVRGTLRHARHGLLGHLYPGMLDVATDLTAVPAQLGGHVEVLEIDDLRVQVEKVADATTDERVALVLETFTLDDSVVGTTCAGRPGSRSRWTGWSRTSGWTAWPTTIGAWMVRRTSGWLRA